MASKNSNTTTTYRIHISAEVIDDHQHQTPLYSSNHDHFISTIVFKVFERKSSYDRTSFAPKTSFVDHETTFRFTHPFRWPSCDVVARAAVSSALSSIESTGPITGRLYWEDRAVSFDAVVSKISDAAGSARLGSRLLVTVEKRVAVVVAAERESRNGMSRDRVFPRSMDLASLC